MSLNSKTGAASSRSWKLVGGKKKKEKQQIFATDICWIPNLQKPTFEFSPFKEQMGGGVRLHFKDLEECFPG